MEAVNFLKEKKEISSKLMLDSPEAIEEVLNHCRLLYQNEQSRRNIIEKKVNFLIIASVIATAFITGFLSLYIFEIINLSLFFVIITVLLCILLGYFMIELTKFFTRRGCDDEYKVKWPDISEMDNLREKDLIKIKQSRAVDYLHSYHKIRDINDLKEIDLISCQKYFKIVILLLLFLPLLFVIDKYVVAKKPIADLSNIKEWLYKF